MEGIRMASLLLPPFLLLQLLGLRVLAVCPSLCSCSDRHREVDCSRRGLRQLPGGLQDNIHSLNLCHNQLVDLDQHLSRYTHLRSLDISYNHLSRLPAGLPRALWELRVAGNRLRLLHKNDTAYHWNLRLLDLSANQLERVVLINNTLPSLSTLNLSHNSFWTVPTNMPHNLEIVDLSHNTLVQILPGSLARLHRLAHFYLHGNRFTSIAEGGFDHLQGLRIITLGENPWACDELKDIRYLLAWLRHTPAQVLGCPCHTRHTCGEAHMIRTPGWHFASYTLSPERTGPWHASQATTRPWSETALFNTHHMRDVPKEQVTLDSSVPLTSPEDSQPTSGIFTTSNGPLTTNKYRTPTNLFQSEGIFTTSTRKTTTLRTRSVKRGHRNMSPEHRNVLTLNILLLTVTASWPQ
ncbi:oligodendrocyte-myelin glycoprotein-like [Denticeps clupeoides]|uniref:LRRNT domain-containing protein n=1 Tax=Denticeps clupeoides TaxID=299321 RepID=A0AAY4CQL8_9TELE|nr:oligodendrocyte-myelin glycoprotein-like [Denticeps clupeoides]